VIQLLVRSFLWLIMLTIVLVDSLKATAVQNWVSRELGAELTSFEFLGSQPTKALAKKIAAASSFVPASS
jgi:hypothetical protein